MDWKLIKEALTKYRRQFAPDYFLAVRMGADSPLITNRARKYEQLTSALDEVESRVSQEGISRGGNMTQITYRKFKRHGEKVYQSGLIFPFHGGNVRWLHGKLPTATAAVIYGRKVKARWERINDYMITGRNYWVDETNGSDANDGLSLETAFATEQRAVFACRPLSRDIIIRVGGE